MDIMKEVQQVGLSGRRHDNIVRRALKTTEEVGELAEACLSITSVCNSKDKQWLDVIEEAVDVAIMGIDIAMTRPNGWEDMTDDEWHMIVRDLFLAKLDKWHGQLEAGSTLISEKALPSFTDEDKEAFIDEFSNRI